VTYGPPLTSSAVCSTGRATSGATAASFSPPSWAAPSTRATCSAIIEAAAKTAGVEGVGVHTLRHSAAVDWLESGVQIKAVADLPVRGIPGSRNAHGRRRVLINAQILRPAIVCGQAARRPVGSLAYWGLLSGRA
jgi:hypothetical protein